MLYSLTPISVAPVRQRVITTLVATWGPGSPDRGLNHYPR